jgi:hypothetical protein
VLGFEADFFVSPEVLVSANISVVIGNTLVVINPAVAYLRGDIIMRAGKRYIAIKLTSLRELE